jgi:hypothetical protein
VLPAFQDDTRFSYMDMNAFAMTCRVMSTMSLWKGGISSNEGFASVALTRYSHANVT